MTQQPVRKAVIPVAGLGTRFLPSTKAIPKEMLPLVDKPVIQYIVEEAVASGIEEVIFVTSENKASIGLHFDRSEELEELLGQKDKEKELSSIKDLAQMAKFSYVSQREPLGLGHAVLQARDAVGDEPFMVMAGDDVIESKVPAARQMIDLYEQYGGSVLGVMEVEEAAVSRYGIIDPDKELGDGSYHIKDVVEKPQLSEAPSRLGSGGRWLLTPDIFDILEHQKPGEAGEIQLTDAIRTLAAQGTVYAKKYEGIYRDCGNKLEYLKAVIAFSLRDEELGSSVRDYIKSLDL